MADCRPGSNEVLPRMLSLKWAIIFIESNRTAYMLKKVRRMISVGSSSSGKPN